MKKQPGVLICMAYYARPNMVRTALNSVANLNYDNWHLVVVDDGGEPVRPLVKEFLGDRMDQVSLYEPRPTAKWKWDNGGSMHGWYFNLAHRQLFDMEYAFPFCDDDALCANGVQELVDWWAEHPEAQYCWNYHVPFDPTMPLPPPEVDTTKGLNDRAPMQYPSCNLDSTQVAWRRSVFDNGVQFAYPATSSLDAHLFQQMYDLYGLCPKTGVALQYKATHPGQMGERPATEIHGDPGDIPQPIY